MTRLPDPVPSSASGFTLLELGIVLIVFSMLAGGILAIVNQNVRQEQKAELVMKMDAIETALKNYRKAWNRLPCPGDLALPEDDGNFAVAAPDLADCTSSDPAATYFDANVAGGSVPARALGLPDEYAYDPWGNRFLYAVDVRATAAAAFTTYPITDTTIGAITVKDANDVNRTTKAVALILSYGPNGNGAYQANGSMKPPESINLHERDHYVCCDADGSTVPFDPTFYMHAPVTTTTLLDEYDDITRYYLRSQLTSSADDLVVTP